ncbi:MULTISPECIES: hypothetical protein [Marinomonas]|nr:MULTISPECIES: hypothetical protein [Marinomonas]
MKKLGLVSCQIPNRIYKQAGNDNLDLPNYLDHQFKVDVPNNV